MLKNLSQVRIAGIETKVYALLVLTVIIGYWPISTGLFALKNDDIIYFLPYRYNIVESLRNNYLPIWSPYIYTGFPVIGDIQSGAWNPIVWIFAIFGRYTLTSLHIELLLYILLAGIGMYKLMANMGFHKKICITIAITYMFSGYMIDSGQILCWISSAAILPYVFLYFHQILQSPSYNNGVKLAVANVALIVISGYPFFFIICQYFMAFAGLAHIIHLIYNRHFLRLKELFLCLTLAVLLFCLLIAAPLQSYLDLFPFYSRGKGLSLQDSLINSFTLFSGISLLFPLAGTQKHIWFLDNLPTGRNIYVGILLLPFIFKGLRGKRQWMWYLILFFTLTAYLLSLGRQLPVREWAYQHLPLLNTFRHPSNFRLFVIFGLLLIAARGMQYFLTDDSGKFDKPLKLWYITIFIGMLFTVICISSQLSFGSNQLTGFSASELKVILNNMSLEDAILIGFILQFPFLLVSIHFLNKHQKAILIPLIIINILVTAQPQQFITCVSKEAVSAYNQMIKSQPEGFPQPPPDYKIGIPDERISFLYEYKTPVKYFFNKEIAINTFLNNPTILSSYLDLLSDSLLLESLSGQPFIFCADSIRYEANNIKTITWLKKKTTSPESPVIETRSFQPNKIDIIVETNDTAHIVILQNHFPYWKAHLDGNPISIQTVNRTFMGISVPSGIHLLSLQCKPDWLFSRFLISCLGMACCIGFLIFYNYKGK